jgi:putative inorganic carbon (hco3(-)) transporter
LRDVVLVIGMLGFLPLCVWNAAAGVVCWVWFSIMSPHREIYGFAAGQPLNSVIAVATLIGWLSSREKKRWPGDAMPWLMLVWFAWMTLSSLFAPFPDWSWDYWNRIMRIMILVFLTFFVANTKSRIHGIIWAIIVALGFYGVKGGLYTLVTGGGGIVFGPPDSIIYDNNQLALAIVMSLPLANYLRMHTKMRLLQLGFALAICLEVVMVFGSHSRGGVLALGVTLFFFWLRTRRKLLYGFAAVVLIGTVLYLMPDSFWERMSTVNNLDEDASFQGRVMAWWVAFYVARDRFPFGGGFYGPQLAPIFNSYFPDANTHAAHSIYFQVLGEHGFIGLALYLPILLLALNNTRIIMRQTRGKPELLWAYDLGAMTQVSLIGFYVGGAALSVAYFDGFLLLIALMSTLRALTAPKPVPARGSQNMPAAGVAVGARARSPVL